MASSAFVWWPRQPSLHHCDVLGNVRWLSTTWRWPRLCPGGNNNFDQRQELNGTGGGKRHVEMGQFLKCLSYLLPIRRHLASMIHWKLGFFPIIVWGHALCYSNISLPKVGSGDFNGHSKNVIFQHYSRDTNSNGLWFQGMQILYCDHWFAFFLSKPKKVLWLFTDFSHLASRLTQQKGATIRSIAARFIVVFFCGGMPDLDVLWRFRFFWFNVRLSPQYLWHSFCLAEKESSVCGCKLAVRQTRRMQAVCIFWMARKWRIYSWLQGYSHFYLNQWPSCLKPLRRHCRGKFYMHLEVENFDREMRWYQHTGPWRWLWLAYVARSKFQSPMILTHCRWNSWVAWWFQQSFGFGFPFVNDV